MAEEEQPKTGGGYEPYGADMLEGGGTGLAIDEYGGDDFDYDAYNSPNMAAQDEGGAQGRKKQQQAEQPEEENPLDDPDPNNDPTGASDYNPLNEDGEGGEGQTDEEKAAAEAANAENAAEDERQTLAQRAGAWAKKKLGIKDKDPKKKPPQPLTVKWMADNYVKYRMMTKGGLKEMFDQLNVAVNSALTGVSLFWDKLLGFIHQKYVIPSHTLDAILEMFGIIPSDPNAETVPSLTWQALGPLFLSTTSFMGEKIKGKVDFILGLPVVKQLGEKITEAVDKLIGELMGKDDKKAKSA